MAPATAALRPWPHAAEGGSTIAAKKGKEKPAISEPLEFPKPNREPAKTPKRAPAKPKREKVPTGV